MATTRVQQHINDGLQTAAQNQSNSGGVVQLDGPGDSSDEENDDVEDDAMEEEDDYDDEEHDDENQDEEIPDSKDNETKDLFKADNVIVCQYEKITRRGRNWKLRLKDGIMNINGRDYVFGKASGNTEWWIFTMQGWIVWMGGTIQTL